MTEYNLPVNKQGKYLIIDTTHKSDQGIFFDEMSGDKGDAGRKVYLAIKERANSNDPKDPLMPMDLTGKDVRFQGHDAKGMWKRIALATKIENAKAGLVEITLPRYIYQAVGPYQNGEFEIFETKGGTNVSTVRVGFEVYDNGAHLTVGESVHYSDEFEALMGRIEKEMGQSLASIKKEITSANSAATSVTNSMTTLQTLIETFELQTNKKIADWEKLLKASGVITPNGNHTLAGDIEFLKTIKGHAAGVAIKVFGGSDPQQDFNDSEPLVRMKSGTTEEFYYTGNKVKNNPIGRDYIHVVRQKLTSGSIMERAQAMYATGEITIMSRIVTDLTTTPTFGKWALEAKYTPWTSLVPYLTADFKSYFSDGSIPMFKFDANQIQLRGQIAPTRKIALSKHDQKVLIAKGLPFKSQTSQRIAQIWSGEIPYTLRLEGDELWAERFYSNVGTVATLDAGNLIAFGGSFALV
jgi:hypothetical protein